MKFKIELPINKPRTAVWKFFRDREKTNLWQPSLKKIKSVNGITDQPGAESKWTYEERGREFSLTEKVLQCEEPVHFESLFENAFASDVVSNRFIERTQNETLWIAETKYNFKTLLMKILGPLYKKNYIARAQKEMERFKEQVEKD